MLKNFQNIDDDDNDDTEVLLIFYMETTLTLVNIFLYIFICENIFSAFQIVSLLCMRNKTKDILFDFRKYPGYFISKKEEDYFN